MSNSLNYTYIYFNTVDYTGNSSLSSFTLPNTPLTFIADFTTSSILSGAQNISNKTLRWDFGDGTYSTELKPTHNYQWPGSYNVTLTIFDNTGKAYDSTYSPTVNIFDYVSTQIAFQDFNSLIYDIPAGRLIDPLTIDTHFSWQSYQSLSATGYTINLYASGAHGAYNYLPLEQHDKWSHLRSLSRFYTLTSFNGNFEYVTIESIQPTVTPIYVNIQNNQMRICSPTDPGSVLAGVTGSCQFWYTDDAPSNLLTEASPTIIFAALDNSKFDDAFTFDTDAFTYINRTPYGIQNIDPAVFPNIKTRYNPAARLSITTTGIDGEGALPQTEFDIPYISWQNTEIPYVIKFKDDQNFTTKNYPALSSSVTENSNTPQQPYYDVQTGIIYSADGITYQPVSGVKFYEDFASNAPQSVGAFYKGYFIPSETTENCFLTAAVTVVDPPYYQKDSLVGWISIPQYKSALRLLRQEQINGFDNTTKITFTGNGTGEFNTGNNANIYAVTVAPSGTEAANDYQAWFADATNDVIVKYDVNGNSLPVSGTDVYRFALSAMPTRINNQINIIDYRSTASNGTSGYAAPNNIALDRNGDIWVTLFDSGSAIKINTNGGYVTTIATPISSALLSNTNTYSLCGFSGDSAYMPSSIDTDINNDIWIAYTHPDFNYLIKYRGTNNINLAADILATVSFPSGITPEQIQIDRNGFVWATAINHNSTGLSFNTRNDYLYKFDSNGIIVDGFPLTGFTQIGNLTIDGSQNAWVVQGAETLTKVDGVTNQTSDYVAGLGNNITEYVCSIGGIACDTSNNIWVINNFDNNMYVIDASLPPTGVLNPKYIIPLTYPTTGVPVLSSYTTPVSVPPNTYVDGIQEFQAIGDWNGYGWLNKYAAPVSTIRTITGSSALFNIYPDGGKFNIAKINENWDASGYYDSLRYQETLIDKQVFFDQFLGVIVGKLNAQPYELGKTVYEKIANFVDNNADIDKVNLNELISFCSELTIELEQYNFVLPPQLRRLVDLLSIKQSKLWGSANQYALNFNPRGTMFHNAKYGANLGTSINPITGSFVNGTPIVVQETFSDNYSLVNTTLIDGYNIGDIIPLSAYNADWGWGLVASDSISGSQIKNYYNFYTYNNTTDGVYFDNIIDWTNPLTTLSPTNSSYTNWSTDNGIVQSLLSYELTKGFRLFTSAANITYNS